MKKASYKRSKITWPIPKTSLTPKACIFSKLKAIKGKVSPQSGAVAIIIGIVMTALIGVMAYVIDTGSVYQSRRSLQTVADSAALAAAQELPENPSLAVQAAIDYAAMHEVALSADNITISSTYIANDTVTVVAADSDKELFFGWVFNLNSTVVGARASAVVGSPEEYDGVVPWGVQYDEWQPGSHYTLKSDKPGTPGNFQALAIGGTGASLYTNNIANGSSVPLKTGDWINTETGNMTGPTSDGTDKRVYEKDDYILNDANTLLKSVDGGYELKKNDSQFVICPVIPMFPSGRKEVEIVMFAPFLITGFTSDSVSGIFINKALIVYEGQISGLDGSGLRVLRLLN